MESFDTFSLEVRKLLEGTAESKGYNNQSADGPNELYSLISSFAGPNHALGEIIYKAIRYSKKKDKNDLLKIAAWSYLVWRFDFQEQSLFPEKS